MSRLLDRLRVMNNPPITFAKKPFVVFVADNVYAEPDTALFSCRLPYPNMFIEIRRNGRSWGVFPSVYISDEYSRQKGVLYLTGIVEYQKGHAGLDFGAEIEFNLNTFEPGEVYILPIGKTEGREVQDPNTGYFKMTPETEAEVRSMLAPIFATLTLLNCNNVQIVDQDPPPALSKRHEKKRGIPLVKYKTLHVVSMAKVHYLKDVPNAPRNDPSRDLPLHDIRGHLKDYRDGKGLFGKHRGVYWWTPHTKGNPTHGIIVKDYEIEKGEDQ